MILEAHMKLCVTVPDFFFFLILPQKWPQMGQNKVFISSLKKWLLVFSVFVLQ